MSKNWIQKATKSIKSRGTEGVCTGDKFGSPSCPKGSKRYNLAKTFRKMNKKAEGGESDELSIQDIIQNRAEDITDVLINNAQANTLKEMEKEFNPMDYLYNYSKNPDQNYEDYYGKQADGGSIQQMYAERAKNLGNNNAFKTDDFTEGKGRGNWGNWKEGTFGGLRSWKTKWNKDLKGADGNLDVNKLQDKLASNYLSMTPDKLAQANLTDDQISAIQKGQMFGNQYLRYSDGTIENVGTLEDQKTTNPTATTPTETPTAKWGRQVKFVNAGESRYNRYARYYDNDYHPSLSGLDLARFLLGMDTHLWDDDKDWRSHHSGKSEGAYSPLAQWKYFENDRGNHDFWNYITNGYDTEEGALLTPDALAYMYMKDPENTRYLIQNHAGFADMAKGMTASNEEIYNILADPQATSRFMRLQEQKIVNPAYKGLTKEQFLSRLKKDTDYYYDQDGKLVWGANPNPVTETPVQPEAPATKPRTASKSTATKPAETTTESTVESSDVDPEGSKTTDGAKPAEETKPAETPIGYIAPNIEYRNTIFPWNGPSMKNPLRGAKRISWGPTVQGNGNMPYAQSQAPVTYKDRTKLERQINREMRKNPGMTNTDAVRKLEGASIYGENTPNSPYTQWKNDYMMQSKDPEDAKKRREAIGWTNSSVPSETPAETTTPETTVDKKSIGGVKFGKMKDPNAVAETKKSLDWKKAFNFTGNALDVASDIFKKDDSAQNQRDLENATSAANTYGVADNIMNYDEDENKQLDYASQTPQKWVKNGGYAKPRWIQLLRAGGTYEVNDADRDYLDSLGIEYEIVD